MPTLNENMRLRDWIQSSDTEPSGSGANSGSGILPGKARTSASALNTVLGPMAAAFFPNNYWDVSTRFTRVEAASRTARASIETAVPPLTQAFKAAYPPTEQRLSVETGSGIFR